MHPGQGTEEVQSPGPGLPNYAEVRDHLLPFPAGSGLEGAEHRTQCSSWWPSGGWLHVTGQGP